MDHQITTIQLNGLSCEACKKVVERRLGKLAEVMSVDVSLEEGIVAITAMRPVTVDEVKEALKDTEYEVIGLVK